LNPLTLQVRAGLHPGECEVIGTKLGGIAVHIGARVAAEAAADEVLVSSTVKDLVAGSGLSFANRGTRLLKGVPRRMAPVRCRGRQWRQTCVPRCPQIFRSKWVTPFRSGIRRASRLTGGPGVSRESFQLATRSSSAICRRAQDSESTGSMPSGAPDLGGSWAKPSAVICRNRTAPLLGEEPNC